MKRKYLACTILTAALSFSVAHAKTKPTTTINGGGSSIVGPTYIAEFQAYTASKPTILFSYAAVGAGSGQKAFLNNNINYFLPYSSSNTIGYTSGTLTYGTVVGTQVDLAAADAPLAASQLTNPATGSYTESGTDGPLIQIPTLGVPIVLAFNQTAITGDALTLTDSQICGVLSGKITDWHTLDSSISSGTTINVVYFSNSSGATYLLTQHLNAVCNSSNSTFPTLPVPITKYFYSTTAANNPVFSTTPPTNFTGENAAANAASELVSTSNSLGYLSPDYTSIAPHSANTTSLQVASLVNATNQVAYAPTVANTELGLLHPGAGSTNASPPTTLSASQNPLNWVPTIPQTSQGYPIVGYGTWELSSCYANKTAGTALIAFLKDQYEKSGSYTTIITNNGFTPLLNSGAAKYVTPVTNVFLSNKSGYNLDIDDATTCASYAGR